MADDGDKTDQTLERLTTAAEGVDRETLGLRADRLDGILNGQIMPTVALHAMLVGACVLMRREPSHTLALAWALIATLVIVFGLAQPKGPRRWNGLLGAGAAFITAALLSWRLPAIPTAGGIAAAYALLAIAALRERPPRPELMFAPIYSATLVALSPLKADDILLFAPIFAAGGMVAAVGKTMRSMFGVFVGFLIVLGAHFEAGPQLAIVALCLVALISLVVYVARSATRTNSNLMNFTVQGLAAGVILAVIEFFLRGETFLWLWPFGLAIFFLAVRLARGEGGEATAIAWICIAFTAALWIGGPQLDNAGQLAITGLLSLAVAAILHTVGRRLHNPFAGDTALALMLAVEGLAAGFLREHVGDAGAGAASDLMLAKGGALAISLGMSLVALLILALHYGRIREVERVSWWRGFVRPRHALVMRSTFRASKAWFSDVPLVGNLLKLFSQGFSALRYLKSDAERLRFADLAMLGATGLVAFAALHLLGALLNGGLPDTDKPPPSVAWIASSITFGACAVLMYVFGLFVRQTLFVFAGAALALAPFGYYALNYSSADADQIAAMAVGLGLVIVLCASLRLTIERKPVRQTRPG